MTLAHAFRLRGVPASPPEATEPPQAARTETIPVTAVQSPAPSGGTAQASAPGWLRGIRRNVRDASQQDDHWVRDGLAGRPPSVDQQRSHLANRGWLDPGHEGGIADRAGEAFI